MGWSRWRARGGAVGVRAEEDGGAPVESPSLAWHAASTWSFITAAPLLLPNRPAPLLLPPAPVPQEAVQRKWVEASRLRGRSYAEDVGDGGGEPGGKVGEGDACTRPMVLLGRARLGLLGDRRQHRTTKPSYLELGVSLPANSICRTWLFFSSVCAGIRAWTISCEEDVPKLRFNHYGWKQAANLLFLD